VGDPSELANIVFSPPVLFSLYAHPFKLAYSAVTRVSCQPVDVVLQLFFGGFFPRTIRKPFWDYNLRVASLSAAQDVPRSLLRHRSSIARGRITFPPLLFRILGEVRQHFLALACLRKVGCGGLRIVLSLLLFYPFRLGNKLTDIILACTPPPGTREKKDSGFPSPPLPSLAYIVG